MHFLQQRMCRLHTVSKIRFPFRHTYLPHTVSTNQRQWLPPILHGTTLWNWCHHTNTRLDRRHKCGPMMLWVP